MQTRTALAFTHISKTYGLNTVLNDISLILNFAERIGLVGANGVGKLTLLKIAAGEVQPEVGTITRHPALHLGYLPQVIIGYDASPIEALIAEANAHLDDLEAQLRNLETTMTLTQDEALDAILSNYGDLTEAYERAGGYDAENRLDQIFEGLHIAHLDRSRAFGTFSGGERARVGLALLLLGAPDLLLLDEPTNHLDRAALEWLETYLAAYPGAMLIVSHDREFLNRAVNVIVEIDETTRRAKRYAGNYDQYAVAKITERRQWEADWAREQETIKALEHEMKEGGQRNNNYRAHTDNDKFVRNIKKDTHAQTVSKRVRAAGERLARILENPIPQPPEPLAFKGALDPAVLKGRLPVALTHVRKAYGEHIILENVSLTIEPAARIVLIGENGAGKSTLIRLITGSEVIEAGEIYRNAGARIGYLAQNAASQTDLPSDDTLFEAYRVGMAENDQAAKASLLHSGLFRYANFDTPVTHLSSGQARKLQIARLIAARANVLLLDEPTNDISFDVLEGLETALSDFQGAVIAASHDRRFIETMQKAGAAIYTVRDGGLWHV